MKFRARAKERLIDYWERKRQRLNHYLELKIDYYILSFSLSPIKWNQANARFHFMGDRWRERERERDWLIIEREKERERERTIFVRRKNEIDH